VTAFVLQIVSDWNNQSSLMIWNTAFSVDLSAELESPQDGANAKLDSPCFL